VPVKTCVLELCLPVLPVHFDRHPGWKDNELGVFAPGGAGDIDDFFISLIFIADPFVSGFRSFFFSGAALTRGKF
jgi:hypothetical protein